MARLLLLPIVLLFLLAALLPLAVALVAGATGLAAGLADSHLQPALHAGLAASALIGVVSIPFGLTMSLWLWQATRWARLVALSCAVMVVLAPAPSFAAMHLLTLPDARTALALLCSLARGTALAVLILSAGLVAVPQGLPRAAAAAGARPLQVVRHALLAPLAVPLLAAALAAFVSGLAQGPAGLVIAPHLDMADAWIAPACLMLAGACMAALSVLLRAPPA